MTASEDSTRDFNKSVMTALSTPGGASETPGSVAPDSNASSLLATPIWTRSEEDRVNLLPASEIIVDEVEALKLMMASNAKDAEAGEPPRKRHRPELVNVRREVMEQAQENNRDFSYEWKQEAQPVNDEELLPEAEMSEFPSLLSCAATCTCRCHQRK